MKIYLVVRCGVHCRETFGCFSTYDLALAGVQRARKIEPDNYHSFVIQERNMDEDVFTENVSSYHESPDYFAQETVIFKGHY